MSSTYTSLPVAVGGVPEWLRELDAARTVYAERLGWSVAIEVQPRRLVAAVGERMDALTMPAELGKLVFAELEIAMCAGPVIAGPGQWWTFLTELATATSPTVPADLAQQKVRLAPRRAHVVLPPRWDSEEWINRPEPQHTLPRWSVVIGRTRQVVERKSKA